MKETKRNGKAIVEFCRYNEINDIKTVYSEMINDESDFEIDNFRFIHEDIIDDIMKEELSSDEYILGCFNSWFLSDILDIDEDVIKVLQEQEAYEALGKLVISMNKIDDLVEKYVSCDRYGHHFNHYDGSEEQLLDYYVFRTN